MSLDLIFLHPLCWLHALADSSPDGKGSSPTIKASVDFLFILYFITLFPTAIKKEGTSSSEPYLLYVFYKDVDKFGNKITQLAHPLCMVYLIINHNFPQGSSLHFSTRKINFLLKTGIYWMGHRTFTVWPPPCPGIPPLYSWIPSQTSSSSCFWSLVKPCLFRTVSACCQRLRL